MRKWCVQLIIAPLLLLSGTAWAERATVNAILTGTTYLYGMTTGAFNTYRGATSGAWSAGIISVQASANTANTVAHFRRGNLVFPLKSANIPANATVSACSIYYKVAAEQSSTWWIVWLYGANARRPVLTNTDHGVFHGWQSGTTGYNGTSLGSIQVNSKSNNSTYGAAFSSAGLDSVIVSLADTLWIAAVLDQDKTPTLSTDDTFPIFSIYGTDGVPPFLAIQYTVPGSAVTNNRRFMQRNGRPTPVQSKGSPVKRSR